MLGRMSSVVQSYVFSDFRMVQGIATPFKIEHLANGAKVDEMIFSFVRYNTGLTNYQFHP
jgi:hypothetical protein